MPTPSIQTLVTDAQQVLNLDSISAVRSVVAVALANANTGTPLNPNLTTQQLWNEFYQVVTKPKSDIESIIANQLMKFLYAPPAPGGAGANKQVIFNDGGVLAGDPQFLWDKTTNLLTVTGSATITGDLTVDTSTLKVVSASDVVGINTTSPLTGNDAGLTIGAIGTVKALNIGLQNTFARLREKDAIDAFAITTNITASNTQDDATKSSWKARMGFGNGNDNFIISRSGVGSTTFYDLLAVSTGSCVWYDGAGGTRMTLNSTGLGVGGSPSYKLSAIGTTNNQVVLHVGNTAGTVDGDTTNVVRFAAGSGANALWANARYDGFSHAWRCNSTTTEAMVLNSSGNVGIGVTPSAWSGAGVKVLDVGAAGSFAGSAADVGVVGNAYYNGSGWIYKTSFFSGRYAYALGTGQHQWYTAPSGTAGNAITFTQAMTLDASGNLLVGKTAIGTTVGVEVRPDGYIIATRSASTDAAAFTNAVYSTGASAYRFYVGLGGTVYATNTTISAISDARLKENVQDIDVGLGAILALKPRKFDWKEGKGKNIKGDRGFIAQEFEQVFPQLVDQWADEAPEGEAPYKSVRQDLIPVLVKAIQELTARVQTLETR